MASLLFDKWSLVHFVNGIVGGMIVWALPVSNAWRVVLFILGMLLWELFEWCGRRLHWTWGCCPVMWEPEDLVNSLIGDLVSGACGAAMSYPVNLVYHVSTLVRLVVGFAGGGLLYVSCGGGAQAAGTIVAVLAVALTADSTSAPQTQWLAHPLAAVAGSCLAAELGYRQGKHATIPSTAPTTNSPQPTSPGLGSPHQSSWSQVAAV